MPNFPSWNDDIYFRFNPEEVSKEFGVPIDKLDDFHIFAVASHPLKLDREYKAREPYWVYPLTYAETNSLIRNGSYPLPLNFWKKKHSFTINNRKGKIEFPEVMAILNLTPDSFYKGSRFSPEEAEIKLDSLSKVGVRMVDIGGESTRPGSDTVDADEEFNRIKETVSSAIEKKFIVSVDTYKPEVARRCLEMGADIINDVMGLRNEEMGLLSKEYDAPLVLMHSKGQFKTMQDSPYYENVINEIIQYFYGRIRLATKMGIEGKIIIDPGIGFGKRYQDNISILRNLRDLSLGYPLMIGLSRKSFIGKMMGEETDDRAISSLILNTIAVESSADIIRVHDVEENIKLVKIVKKIRENYI
jgi:dihydropteroate synthase